MHNTHRVFDMFQWLPKEVVEAFSQRVCRRRYQAGQTIYFLGDSGNEMYRIASGSVRMLASTPDGREVVFLRFNSNDCFGIASLIDGQPRPHTAEAATAVELDVLSKEDYEEIRKTYREFDQASLKLISRMMRYSSGLFKELSLNALEERIASRILQGVERSEAVASTQDHRKLALSQTEIALMVGASRQTVNRVLQKMQDAGIIETEYNSIIVQDIKGLRALAMGD